jgi:hypothetical protein
MAVGRRFYQPLDGISVTNDSDQDIWVLAAPSTKALWLHGFSLTSNCTSDERVKLRLVRRSTSGSGGSAATEVPCDDDDTTTIAGAVTTLQTTPGTIGDIIAGWQWSQQGELLYLPTPELRPSVSASAFLCLHLGTAVASTRTWSGWLAWEE